jgi:hypothetical protein
MFQKRFCSPQGLRDCEKQLKRFASPLYCIFASRLTSAARATPPPPRPRSWQAFADSSFAACAAAPTCLPCLCDGRSTPASGRLTNEAKACQLHPPNHRRRGVAGHGRRPDSETAPTPHCTEGSSGVVGHVGLRCAGQTRH